MRRLPEKVVYCVNKALAAICDAAQALREQLGHPSTTEMYVIVPSRPDKSGWYPKPTPDERNSPKIEAIKRYRRRTGAPLMTAKVAIETSQGER